MLVKCLGNIVITNGKTYDIKINKIYNVLSLEINCNDHKQVNSFDDSLVYKIMDSYGILMPYPSQLFEIVDSIIPSNWIFKKLNESVFELIPTEWDYDGFWEEYYNGDEVAKRIVNSQRDISNLD